MPPKRKAEEAPATSEPSKPKISKADGDQNLSELKALMQATPGEMGKTAEEFLSHFSKLSHHLLNSVSMVIGSKHRFRLAEIEFYLNGGDHPDIFTHGSEDQKTWGEWYFHKQKDTYKNGTYKGLDITFGAKDSCFGGILIRAVQKVTDNPDEPILEGPCLVVDNILKLSESEMIVDLVKKPTYNPFVFSPDSILRLEAENHPVREIVKSPRFGLTLKKKDPERVDYILRDYRFLSVPSQTSKGKPFIVLSLHLLGNTPEEISKKAGTKLAVVNKYLETYEKSTHTADFFAGKSLNVDLMCQIMAAIKKPKPA